MFSSTGMNHRGTVLFFFYCLSAGSLVHAQQPENDRLLSRTKHPPTYVRNTNYDKKWFEILQTSINKTRDYLGNYGPVQVYIIGQESQELDDPAVGAAIAKAFCRCRHAQTKDKIQDCLKGTGAALIERARNGSTEAYLSYVNYTDPPLAELVFINPHQFKSPYLYTRGIHEYTHVFQRSFPHTPTWMSEGGAEFLAFYLGQQNGWASFDQAMNQSMQMIHRVADKSIGIRDFEDIEAVERERPELKQYYRHLAYDGGVWAVAYMIHRSKTRRVRGYTKHFYPLIERLGWQEALQRYTNVDTVDQFYRLFDSFLKEPVSSQMQLLSELKL